MCADTEHSQLPRRKWNLTLRKDLLSVKLALSCNCAKYHQQEPILGFYCCSTQELPSLSHVCPWKRYWGYPMYLVTSSFLINSHKVQIKDTQLLGEGRTKTVTWQIKKLVLNKCSLNNSRKLQSQLGLAGRIHQQRNLTSQQLPSFQDILLFLIPRVKLFNHINKNFLTDWNFRLFNSWICEDVPRFLPQYRVVQDKLQIFLHLIPNGFELKNPSIFCSEFDDKQKINERLPLFGTVPQLHWDRSFVKPVYQQIELVAKLLKSNSI